MQSKLNAATGMALLLMLLVLPDLFASGGSRPEFDPPQLSESDTKALAELERRAAQLAQSSDAASQDLFATDARNYLGDPYVHAHALLLAGGVYEGAGRKTEALESYRTVVATSRDEFHRLVAIDAVVSILRSQQEYGLALQDLDSFLSDSKLRSDARSYLSISRAQLLARLKRTDEAVDSVQSLFKNGELSEESAGGALEEIAVDAMSGPESIKTEEIYRWTVHNLPSFANKPRFRGNFAHVLETRGHLDEAIEARISLAAEFPADSRRLENLLEAANLLCTKGRYEEAVQYYKKIEAVTPSRNADATIKSLAKTNLQSALIRLASERPVPTVDLTRRSSSNMTLLILANAAVIAVLGVVYYLKRKRA